MLIDPEGKLYKMGSGEGLYEALDREIAKLIEIHKAKGTLNEKPIRFDSAEFRSTPDTPLYFPGKILADAAGKRLFIADSTHHRIVVTDLTGAKIAIAGAGQPGKVDGPFAAPRGSKTRRGWPSSATRFTSPTVGTIRFGRLT